MLKQVKGDTKIDILRDQQNDARDKMQTELEFPLISVFVRLSLVLGNSRTII